MRRDQLINSDLAFLNDDRIEMLLSGVNRFGFCKIGIAAVSNGLGD